MEIPHTHPLDDLCFKKNNLTLLKTTIHPTSTALKKLLGQRSVKLLLITGNPRLAQRAYDHLQVVKADNRQLIWAPRPSQHTLRNSIPLLPTDLSGIDGMVLTAENRIAATLQAGDPDSAFRIEELCHFTTEEAVSYRI